MSLVRFSPSPGPGWPRPHRTWGVLTRFRSTSDDPLGEIKGNRFQCARDSDRRLRHLVRREENREKMRPGGWNRRPLRRGIHPFRGLTRSRLGGRGGRVTRAGAKPGRATAPYMTPAGGLPAAGRSGTGTASRHALAIRPATARASGRLRRARAVRLIHGGGPSRMAAAGMGRVSRHQGEYQKPKRGALKPATHLGRGLSKISANTNNQPPLIWKDNGDRPGR